MTTNDAAKSRQLPLRRPARTRDTNPLAGLSASQMAALALRPRFGPQPSAVPRGSVGLRAAPLDAMADDDDAVAPLANTAPPAQPSFDPPPLPDLNLNDASAVTRDSDPADLNFSPQPSAVQEHEEAQQRLSDFTGEQEPYALIGGAPMKMTPTVRGLRPLPVADAQEHGQAMDWLNQRAQLQDEVNRLKPAANYERRMAEESTTDQSSASDASTTGQSPNQQEQTQAQAAGAASQAAPAMGRVPNPVVSGSPAGNIQPAKDPRPHETEVPLPSEGIDHLQWVEDSPDNRRRLVRELARQAGEATKNSGSAGDGTAGKMGTQKEFGGFLIRDKKTGRIAITELTGGRYGSWNMGDPDFGGDNLYNKYAIKYGKDFDVVADLHSHPDQGDALGDNFFSRGDLEQVAQPYQTWSDSFLAAPDGTIKNMNQAKARFTQQWQRADKDIGSKSPAEQTQHAFENRRTYYINPRGGASHSKAIVNTFDQYGKWR